MMGFAEGASRQVAQLAMEMVKEPLCVKLPFVLTQHLSGCGPIPEIGLLKFYLLILVDEREAENS